MILYLLIVLSLFLLSAFFSMSETAITASSQGYMMRLKKTKKSKNAKTAYHLLENKDAVISTILIGNNIANVMLTIFSTSLFLSLYNDKYLVAFGFVIAILLMIFAEILPKTLAVKFANNVVLVCAPILYFFYIILKPFNHAVLIFRNKIIEPFEQNKETTSADIDDYNVEKLRGAIELFSHENTEHNTDTIHEKEMLNNVLDLDEITVQDLMIHRKDVSIIDITKSIENIIEEIKDLECKFIPVCQGDKENITGAIKPYQVLLEYVKNKNINIEDYVIQVNFIADTTTAMKQLLLFKDDANQYSIIVDEYGAFMGIITLDIILHEIVNTEQNQEDGILIKDNSFIVDSKTKIRKLNKKLHLNLPEDVDATTIGGLLLYQTNGVPKLNQEVAIEGYTLKAVKFNHKEIELIEINRKEDS